MNFHLRANLIALSLFVPLSMLVTAAISYYDEGMYRAYNGFLDFLYQRGVVFSDLVVWSTLFTGLWLAMFNAQLFFGKLEQRIMLRLVLAMGLTPFAILICLVMVLAVVRLLQWAL